MNLVIGPGGMGIYAFLGGISCIGLDNISEVSGASAGAMLGLFICTGKTVEEITEFCFGIDLKELSSLNIASFITNFGFIPHGPIKKVLKDFCGDPTFKDLSKKLYVTAFCVNRSETEYFSVDTHPDMSVIDAVYMSISVPFLFETIKYNTYTYLDGGSRESVPVMAFMNKEPDSVLILKLEDNREHVPEILDLKSFIQSLVSVAIESRVTISTFSKTVSIDMSDSNIFDFLMSHEDKMKLFVRGYQATLSHLGSFK
jgi:predicted acylesterase/phospholipase RssA